MKRTAFFTVLVSQCLFSFAQDPVVSGYGKTITEDELRNNLTILASDALEGRETGTRGQKMAAAFIAAHFQELGLIAPVSGSYYQPIDLYSSTSGEVYIKTAGTTYSNNDKIIYLGSADSGGEVSLPLVFAGNGTEQDFEQVVVSGKAVFFFAEGRLTNNKAIALAREKAQN